MDQLTITLIHVLLASILALGPLSIALYLDLKQKNKTEEK